MVGLLPSTYNASKQNLSQQWIADRLLSLLNLFFTFFRSIRCWCFGWCFRCWNFGRFFHGSADGARVDGAADCGAVDGSADEAADGAADGLPSLATRMLEAIRVRMTTDFMVFRFCS